MKNRAKIMVYDSGAGGLSIAHEILQQIPNCQLVYAADNAFFPYGTKNDELLSARIIEQVGKFHQRSGADIVVIACNTASTLALETLRSQFSIPFVGVVPAIKPAAIASHTGAIGILATSATIRRAYTHKLIQEFAAHCSVLLHGSDALVGMAEDKIRGQTPRIETLNEELKVFVEGDHKSDGEGAMDTLVLACTHFPLLREEISAFFQQNNRSVKILDSGFAIAARVKSLLSESFDLRGDNNPLIEILLSSETDENEISTSYRRYLRDKTLRR